jgi:hypothetical protein
VSLVRGFTIKVCYAINACTIFLQPSHVTLTSSQHNDCPVTPSPFYRHDETGTSLSNKPAICTHSIP